MSIKPLLDHTAGGLRIQGNVPQSSGLLVCVMIPQSGAAVRPHTVVSKSSHLSGLDRLWDNAVGWLYRTLQLLSSVSAVPPTNGLVQLNVVLNLYLSLLCSAKPSTQLLTMF
jgi:hypothetical protein